jgi:peptidoglycan/LPS O-acetylase OafA/YrhL
MVLVLVGIAALVAGILIAIFSREQWSRATSVTRVDLFSAWMLVSLGAIHSAATPLFHEQLLTSAALWFASGGIAMALTGSHNILRIRYGGLGPAIRRASIAANLAMLALSVGFVARAGSTILRRPQYAVVLALVVTAAILSLRKPAPTDARNAS